jgi:hypothetical protein
MGTFTVIPMPALIQENRNPFVFWSPSALPDTTKQMNVKEGRDIYVNDTMVALVYECSSPVIQDAIDLAISPHNGQPMY